MYFFSFNCFFMLLLVSMQSVAYTAVPFFIAALIWFVILGLCLLLICLCYRCCRREHYGYSRMAYALSLIFLVLFTIAAMYSLSLPILLNGFNLYIHRQCNFFYMTGIFYPVVAVNLPSFPC